MNKSTLKALKKDHGEAFYVFDQTLFDKNLNNLKNLFAEVYGNVELAYSFKTNYIPRICQIVLEKGLLAEVVSEMEYKHALNVGFTGNNVIFNGPLKSKKILYEAFKNNSIVHFDSFEEIEYLKLYLNENPGEFVRCSVRCNFEIQDLSLSRFGFSVEDGSAEKAYRELFNISGCLPVGVHGHFQTSKKSLKSFEERTLLLANFAKKVFKDKPLEYVDIGGGFFGSMPEELINQFSYEVPSAEQYASVVGNIMKDTFPKENVKLIIEPGNIVVADTIKFYCSVNNIKFIRDKYFIVVNGSLHNIKPTGRSRILPSFKLFQMGEAKYINVKGASIVGYTCFEEDILVDEVNQSIAKGDFVEFSNVGAYSIMLKPPFIKGQPKILAYDGSKYEVIKNSENGDYLFSSYIF